MARPYNNNSIWKDEPLWRKDTNKRGEKIESFPLYNIKNRWLRELGAANKERVSLNPNNLYLESRHFLGKLNFVLYIKSLSKKINTLEEDLIYEQSKILVQKSRNGSNLSIAQNCLGAWREHLFTFLMSTESLLISLNREINF